MILGKMFSMLGSRFERQDIAVDGTGKGKIGKYISVIEEDIDLVLEPKLLSVIKSVMSVRWSSPEYVPLLEAGHGIIDRYGQFVLYMGESRRKDVIRFWHSLNNWKGTLTALQMLMGWLGYTVVLTTHYNIGNFDSGLGFDADNRTFDNVCNACVYYDVALTGPVLVTQELYDAVFSALQYNNPVNGAIGVVTLNGLPFVVPPAMLGTFNSSFNSSFN
jgi:hypothetical protein